MEGTDWNPGCFFVSLQGGLVHELELIVYTGCRLSEKTY